MSFKKRFQDFKEFLKKDQMEIKVMRIKKRMQVNEAMLASIFILERENKHIVQIGGSYHVSQPEAWLKKVNFNEPLMRNPESKRKIETTVNTELVQFDNGTFAIMIRGVKNEE